MPLDEELLDVSFSLLLCKMIRLTLFPQLMHSTLTIDEGQTLNSEKPSNESQEG